MKKHTEESIAQTPNREGFALVTALLVVLVLSVLAVAVAWMATSEKKVSFAEGVHVRSVYSADAGGEVGINFLRLSNQPPHTIDYATDKVMDVAETPVLDSQTYETEAFYEDWDYRPGWDVEFFRDFNYTIEATGRASTKGQSSVDVVASRLYKLGY